jgi:hypothetical protein
MWPAGCQKVLEVTLDPCFPIPTISKSRNAQGLVRAANSCLHPSHHASSGRRFPQYIKPSSTLIIIYWNHFKAGT